MTEHPRTVVITGCASGIGAAAVQRFARTGDHIVGVDRNPSEDPAVDHMIIGDLSTPEGVAAIADEIPGGVNVLINNAGVAGTNDWRTVLSINTLAPRDLTRALIPKFATDPAVVITASQAGFRWQADYHLLQRFLAVENWDEALEVLADKENIDHDAYSLSKEAVIVLAQNMTITGKHIHMRVNTISPGVVDTPLLPDFREHLGAQMIDGSEQWAGRHARPEEIADAMYFLTSDDARWISGIDLPVDGGFSSFVMKTFVAPYLPGADQ